MVNSYGKWAARWPQAAAELSAMCSHAPAATPGAPGSEAYVQSAVRLEAARTGVLLWRNNVGALLDIRGVPVRYGLANDSAQINARIKSADLIGIKRYWVRPEDVGRPLGVFVSRECKAAGWQPQHGGKHIEAQRAWAALVTEWGGDAAIVSGPGSFDV